MKCILSLLLITCYLYAAVQLSTSEPDQPKTAPENTQPDVNEDHSHKSRTDSAEATSTLSDDHVNNTDTESSGATFVRASDAGDHEHSRVRNDDTSSESHKGDKRHEK